MNTEQAVKAHISASASRRKIGKKILTWVGFIGDSENTSLESVNESCLQSEIDFSCSLRCVC